MSRHKKQLKYNKMVQKIFGGDSFDEGVLRLSEEERLELAMLLELDVLRADDEAIIKALRRTWSMGERASRAIIVEYLNSLHHDMSTSHEELQVQKEQKLKAILDKMELDSSEYELLFNHFASLSNKKINALKIERFLKRYRRQKKYDTVAKQAHGSYVGDGRFEFYMAFDVELFGHTLKKIFVLQCEGLSEADFEAFDEESLIAKLEKNKTQSIQVYKEQLDALIKALSKESHPYLTQEERLSWFKALEPESDLESFALAPNLLQKIIKTYTDIHKLEVSTKAIHAIKRATFVLHDACRLPYTYELTEPLWRISALIIKGERLDFDQTLHSIQESMIEAFKREYEALFNELWQEAKALDYDKKALEAFLCEQLRAFFKEDRALALSAKMKRKIETAFHIHTVDMRRAMQRELLLARTIRDFKALFPLARSLRRKIVFHVGPTNSGKTYSAMQALQSADTGSYLAPLRLLALEGYEHLKSRGIATILLTGEEELFDEDAGHVSSTIEMADFNTDIDVAVIDEIQMIADRDRGWAWANALIGVPAKTVYLTGSRDILEAVKRLCEWLGEPLKIVEFERKCEQVLLHKPTPLEALEPQTALIAFSRAQVLEYRQKLSKKYKVSVIYGNLSPEVRREEARRFREKESEILVATDAIAMGLNLPIKTLLFTKESKFDGQNRRMLSASEVQQIAGRAGRYGLNEKGYIGAINTKVLKSITPLLHEPLQSIEPPFRVMANLSHIKLVASILQTDNLEAIFSFFSKHMEFDGPFVAADFEGLAEISALIDRYDLALEDKFTFATAPVSKSAYIMSQFERYVRTFSQGKRIAFIPMEGLPEFADTQELLLEAEDHIKEITLYLWLAYRYEEEFYQANEARAHRAELNAFVEASLEKGAFIKKCHICSKPLPMDYAYNICQSCFLRQKSRYKKVDGFRARPKRSYHKRSKA